MKSQRTFKRDNALTSFSRKDLELGIKRNFGIHRRIHTSHQAAKLSRFYHCRKLRPFDAK